MRGVLGSLLAGDGGAYDSAAEVADRFGWKTGGSADEPGGSPLALDPERERREDLPAEKARPDTVARVASADEQGVVPAEPIKEREPVL